MKTIAFLTGMILTFATTAEAQEEPNTKPGDQKQEEPAGEKGETAASTTRLVIPAMNHKVKWKDVTEAIVQETGVEIPALSHLPERKQINLESWRAELSIIAINFATKSAFRLSIAEDAEAMIVEINNDEIDAIRARLREKLSKIDPEDERKFVIAEFDPRKPITNTSHVVIVIHGFNSEPASLEALSKAISECEDCTAATFAWPSREGVVAASARLGNELDRVLKENPDCTVSIVTHSTGGLIARLVVESPGFKHRQVKKLIMVAPPNHGSNLAALPAGKSHIGSKFFQDTIIKIHRNTIREALNNVSGEYNVSLKDLRPGSEVLELINSQERNPDIAYSIILGRQAALSEDDADSLDTFSKDLRADEGIAEDIALELSVLLNALSGELVESRGDGVVSVESGKLEGVEDVTILSFQHRDLSSEDEKPERKMLIDLVLKKLGED